MLWFENHRERRRLGEIRLGTVNGISEHTNYRYSQRQAALPIVKSGNNSLVGMRMPSWAYEEG